MRRFVVLSCCLALTTQGCDDQTARPDTQQVLVEVPGDRTVNPPMFDDEGNPVPPAPVSGRILVITGDPERQVNVGGTIELGVLLLDSNGDPVPRDRVEFAIVDEDVGTATLSARRTSTDDNGYASVDFIAGDQLRDFKVEVWNPDTRRLQFDIEVVDLPAGGLEVAIEYEGPVALGRLEIFVIDDPDYCEDPYYLTQPEGIVHSGAVDNPLDTFVVNPLLAGTRLSVVVRGRLASNGVLAAGGCLSGVRIVDDEIIRARVPTFLLPLNPAGSYTVENTFDFTNAIPGTLGDVIRGLVRFFGTRNQEREIAGVLFDIVENLARDFGGVLAGLAVELLRGWIEDELNEIINGWIDEDAPDWVQDFFTIGEDVLGIVAEMEVISRMRISKPRRDGGFDGSQNWIGLAFYWRLPCENDPDPRCGRHAFTMDEVAAAAEGIQLVFGQFTGRIHTYNHGIIDSHTMDLQYGRLILFVLNNIVLPFIADGARSIRDALLNLANCPNFANRATGGRGHLRIAGIDIVSRDTIEGWCTTGMTLVGDVASAILGRLRVDTRLTLQGDMMFIEETDDLAVDSMEDGTWRGVIRTAEDEGPPFDGTYSGSIDMEPQDGEGM